jgi:hypothetical protein
MEKWKKLTVFPKIGKLREYSSIEISCLINM